jgi:hypothetical protein
MGDVMGEFYTIARIYAGFMGFTILGGILWFASSLSNAIDIAGTLAGFSSLAAASISPGKLCIHSVRRILLGLCSIGISAGLVLVIDDLGRPSGTERIEWDVVAMKALDVAALAVMAGVALSRKKSMGSDSIDSQN